MCPKIREGNQQQISLRKGNTVVVGAKFKLSDVVFKTKLTFQQLHNNKIFQLF